MYMSHSRYSYGWRKMFDILCCHQILKSFEESLCVCKLLKFPRLSFYSVASFSSRSNNLLSVNSMNTSRTDIRVFGKAKVCRLSWWFVSVLKAIPSSGACMHHPWYHVISLYRSLALINFSECLYRGYIQEYISEACESRVL
jgi:hypothetical protein